MEKPYVIVNCAMSADGKIALSTRNQMKISSPEDTKRMYELRNQNDAILVGINTIISDDPKLTVKEGYVENIRQPIRIILDSNCKTPKNALAVDEKAKTFIISTKKCNNKYGKNIETIICKKDKTELIDLHDLLDILYRRGIKKLMVEGGGTVLWSFFKEKLVDEMFIYVGPIIIGGKDSPTVADGLGIKNQDEKIQLELIDIQRLGPGALFHYRLIK